jgi:hypothetical protein
MGHSDISRRRTAAIIAAATLLTLTIAGAQAADLARRSRIGAVFAEEVRPAREMVQEPIVSYAPEVDIRPTVAGQYGKPNSYYYRSYYGTSPDLIFSRAPYSCGLYGYC